MHDIISIYLVSRKKSETYYQSMNNPRFPIPNSTRRLITYTSYSPPGVSVTPLLGPPLLFAPLKSPDVGAWACCWCCSPRRSTWSATPVKLLLKRVPFPGVCGVAGRRARRSASESDGPGEVLREVALAPWRTRAASSIRPPPEMGDAAIGRGKYAGAGVAGMSASGADKTVTSGGFSSE